MSRSLNFNNRAHTAPGSIPSDGRKARQNRGLKNIQFRSIYDFTHSDHSILKGRPKSSNSDQNRSHSAYALTVEPQKLLWDLTQKGKFTPADDEFTSPANSKICQEETAKAVYYPV